VLELRRSASARAALVILAALAERMPVPVRAIRVDNGSEFMAEFEAACAERGIARFTLPPRSPKLDGRVERANRAHTEAFSAVTDAQPTLAGLRLALPRVGDHLQHGPAPPGPGLAHAGRVPGLVGVEV
jgi:transposase InsO family protein